MADRINWERVAEPQADGYDTEIVKRLGKERYGWAKRWPASGTRTWLEGAVELTVPPWEAEAIEVLEHPNLEVAERILREACPTLWSQFRELIQALHLVLADDMGTGELETGCKCGPMGDRVSFEFQITVNFGVGILEAVVHELAHNKMKTHGISLYHWERLLANPIPTDEAIESGEGEYLYESVIRKDKLRPLGACVSAHYSYLHVSELLLQLLEAGVIGGDSIRQWLEVQRRRVTEGRRQISEVVTPDRDGVPYFDSMQAWADRLIARFDAVL